MIIIFLLEGWNWKNYPDSIISMGILQLPITWGGGHCIVLLAHLISLFHLICLPTVLNPTLPTAVCFSSGGPTRILAKSDLGYSAIWERKAGRASAPIVFFRGASRSHPGPALASPPPPSRSPPCHQHVIIFINYRSSNAFIHSSATIFRFFFRRWVLICCSHSPRCFRVRFNFLTVGDSFLLFLYL